MNVACKNLGFHRIEAHINEDNTPSIQLAERVGLTYECRREKFIYTADEWYLEKDVGVNFTVSYLEELPLIIGNLTEKIETR